MILYFVCGLSRLLLIKSIALRLAVVTAVKMHLSTYLFGKYVLIYLQTLFGCIHIVVTCCDPRVIRICCLDVFCILGNWGDVCCNVKYLSSEFIIHVSLSTMEV